MHLISLNTKNFKRLGTFTCEFTSGLNVILGPNAAGKSSLLKAVLFALYGSPAVPGKEQDITTWGEKGYKVELTFSNDGDTYTVVRTGSKAEVRRGEELVASGKAPCTKYIESLLGLTHDEFKLFIMSVQHKIGRVLDEGATALSRKIEQFAGITLLDQVQQNAQERQRKHQAFIEVCDSQMPEGGWEAELKAVQAKVATSQTALEELKKEFFNAADQIKAVEQEETPTSSLPHPDELQKKRRQWLDAKEAVASAQTKVSSRAAELEGLEFNAPEKPEDTDTDVLRTQVRELADKRTSLSSDLEDMATGIRTVEAVSTRLETEDAKLDRMTAVTEEEVDQAKTNLDSASEAREDAVARLSKVQSELSSARKMLNDGACPTCNRPFEEHQADVEEAQSRIQTLEASERELAGEASAAKSAVKHHSEEHSRLKENLQRYQTQQQTCQELRQRLNDLPEPASQEQLEALRGEVSSANGEIERLRHLISTAEDRRQGYDVAQKRITATKDRLASAERGLYDAQSHLGSLEEITEETVAEARQDQHEIQLWQNDQEARLSQARRHAEDIERHITTAENEIERGSIRIDEIETMIARTAEAAAMADKCGRLVKYIKGGRERFLREVWDSVLAVASRQVATASGGMITSIQYQDGGFKFEEQGLLVPVEECSGAQRGHIGVAIRVGLCRSLYGRDSLMIFDEPTESMREEHAAGLTSSLASISSQTLLITHRETDQALAENAINIGE